MKAVVAVAKHSKADLRTRRVKAGEPILFSHTLNDIAMACDVSMDQVLHDKSRGYFDPDNLRSIAVYIARRIFLRDFK